MKAAYKFLVVPLFAPYPIMDHDFPEPVWPYAKIEVL